MPDVVSQLQFACQYVCHSDILTSLFGIQLHVIGLADMLGTKCSKKKLYAKPCSYNSPSTCRCSLRSENSVNIDCSDHHFDSRMFKSSCGKVRQTLPMLNQEWGNQQVDVTFAGFGKHRVYGWLVLQHLWDYTDNRHSYEVELCEVQYNTIPRTSAVW